MESLQKLLNRTYDWFRAWRLRGFVPGGTLTIILAGLVGLLAGFGAAFFGYLIEGIGESTYLAANHARLDSPWWNLPLIASPALAMLFVSWLTRRFAPEAQGQVCPK